MKPSQLLIALLVLASLAVDAVVVASQAFSHPTNLFTYPLPISQIGLLGLWTGFGRTPFWIRLPAIVAVAGLWSLLLRQGEGTIANQWFLVLSVEALLVLALILIVRLRGIGLTQIDPGDSATANHQEDFRLRFSLRDLFVLVTAVCICLGGMPLLVENWHSLTFGQGDQPMLLAYCGVWAVLSLLATWLALGGRYVVLRIALGLLIVAGVAAFVVLSKERDDIKGAAWITAEHLLLMLSSLLVLRICGYRIVIARQ